MTAPEAPRRLPAWEVGVAVALVAYYLARLLYLALRIAPGLPPDEITHVGLAELYRDSLLPLSDSPRSYPLGLVSRVPYLYHLLMGRVLAFDLSALDSTRLLRLANVAVALVTVLLAYRLAARLMASPLPRLLFLVLLTNTPMWTFLGAAVSYDNLANLLAVAATASLIAFCQTGRSRPLLAFALWGLLGSLTKVTFLPLLALAAVLLVVERRGRFPGDLRRCLAPAWRAPRLLALQLAVLASSVAAAELYGGNLWRYGRPVPSCQQVLAEDACLQNRILVRDWIVTRYRDGALTFQEALDATARIGHPGDRDHAVRLLRNERAFKMTRPAVLPRWRYLGEVWRHAMVPTIFGIQAHRSLLRSPAELVPYEVILFAAFLLWVRGVGWRGEERLWSVLAALALGYGLFLMGWVNYEGYRSSHALFLGVQGRYLFPVLVPAYLVASRVLLERFPAPLRVAVALVVAVVFLVGDFPYFVRHASPEWFAATPGAAAGGATG